MAGGDEENETREIVGWFVDKVAGTMEGNAAGGYTCYGLLVDCPSSR
jgi:hypothetical protein